MKVERRLWLLLILLCCSSLSALGQEELTLVRAEGLPETYLSVEDLAYVTCADDVNVDLRSSLFCLDDSNLVNIDPVPWKDGCSLTYYDLEKINCQRLQLQSEYIQNNDNVKLTDRIRIRRVSSILHQLANGQLSDGSWSDPINTAYALFAYSSFEEAFLDDINSGLKWLKDNRDDSEKCYPTGNCDTKTTATVLSALNFGGYNTSNRIVHDGVLWLLDKQSILTGTDAWKLNFSLTANLTNETTLATCLYNDSESVIFYNFTYTQQNGTNTTTNQTVPPWYEINFTSYNDRRLDLICTENVTANLTSHLDELVLYYVEGDNFTYTLPNSCWSDKSKWDSCQTLTTLLSMMSGITTTSRDAALSYIDDQTKSSAIGNYLHTSDMTLNAYYMYVKDEYYDKSNDTMLQWLFYNQNNDGSWGSGTVEERIEPTASMVFTFDNLGTVNDTEFLEDAKDWISRSEPTGGWSTITKTSLAFHALKNDIRPFVKTQPIYINLVEESMDVVVFNPSTFSLTDLEFEVSEELEGSVIVNAFDELDPDTSRKIKITQTGIQPTNNYGFLTITNGDDEIAKVPMSVFKHETIDITYPESLTIFGTSSTLRLAVTKSGGSFTCGVEWDTPGISSRPEFSVSDASEVSLDIKLKTASRKQEEFAGTLSCVSGLNTKVIPLRVNINQYPSKPFEVSPKLLFINESEQDVAFTVTNLLTEPLTVTLKFAKEEAFFQIDPSNIVLTPRDSQDITIVNLVPKNENLSTASRVVVEALGQTDNVVINTEIEVKSLNFLLFGSVAIFMLAILMAVGILYRNQISQLDFVQNVRSRLPASIGGGARPKTEDLGEAESSIRVKKQMDDKRLQLSIIMNHIRILQNAKFDEDDIKKKLSKTGFMEEDVTQAFAELDTINKEKQDLAQKKSTVNIIESMTKNAAIIRTKLREEGFADKQIQAALTGLREDYKDREKKLKDELREKDEKVD